MDMSLTREVKQYIKKNVMTGRVYLTLIVGLFCIVSSLIKYNGFVSLVMIMFGATLLSVDFMMIRYWLQVNHDKAVLIPVKVIYKEKYDSCNSAACKHNHSYIVLEKENGETVDREISLVRRFMKINVGDCGLIIEAAGFNKFFTFSELGIDNIPSDEIVDK